MRRIAVEDFADRTEAGVTQVAGQRRKQGKCGGRIAVDAPMRAGQRTQQPAPRCALVIYGVAPFRAAGITTAIGGVARTQRAQAKRCPQLTQADIDDRAALRRGQQWVTEGNGKDLIRTQAGVILSIGRVDDVVEIAAGCIPETPIELLGVGIRAVAVVTRHCRFVETLSEAGHDAQRMLPQRIDLDRLADARRDDLGADLGVHPGQLHPIDAGLQQPVLWINLDVVARAAFVPRDDVLERRPQCGREIQVAARYEVFLHGIEQPQRRIDGVVFGRGAIIGKAIGQHALADMAGEGAQNARNHIEARSAMHESGQRDHGVAAPVGEPWITGDDGRAEVDAAPHQKLIRRAGQLSDPVRCRGA